MWIRLLMAVFVGCLAFSCGEADTNAKEGDKKEEGSEEFEDEVIADTEYYKAGPQQATPPDGTIKAGTKVTVLSESGSYSRVKTENGVEGFISTDALKSKKK